MLPNREAATQDLRHYQPPRPKVTNFEVMDEMCERNLDITLAPINSNFLGGKVTKKGTRVEIGCAQTDILHKIMKGELCGGLLLCDKKQFDDVKRELEAERSEGI